MWFLWEMKLIVCHVTGEGPASQDFWLRGLCSRDLGLVNRSTVPHLALSAAFICTETEISPSHSEKRILGFVWHCISNHFGKQSSKANSVPKPKPYEWMGCPQKGNDGMPECPYWVKDVRNQSWSRNVSVYLCWKASVTDVFCQSDVWQTRASKVFFSSFASSFNQCLLRQCPLLHVWCRAFRECLPSIDDDDASLFCSSRSIDNNYHHCHAWHKDSSASYSQYSDLPRFAYSSTRPKPHGLVILSSQLDVPTSCGWLEPSHDQLTLLAGRNISAKSRNKILLPPFC